MKHRVNPRTVVLIAVIVCLVAAAVVLLIRFFPSFGGDQQQEQEQIQQDPDRPSSPAVGVDGEDEPQTSAHQIGQLTVSFDDSALTRVDSEGGLVTLLPDDARPLPRLDLLNLDGSLLVLTDEEIQQLAVGLVQSYYVGAPATAEIQVTTDETMLNAFFLDVPAAGDTPALSAQVRFLEASDGLWCLLLLHEAADAAPTALIAAYETAAVN